MYVLCICIFICMCSHRDNWCWASISHGAGERYSSSGPSPVIILEVNKSQSSTKLFIFGSAFPILHKAFTKPVWAASSAQLSNTAHKLLPSLQIPVVLCISVKWLLGFLLRAQRSFPVAICCSSQPPIFIWPCRSSSLHPVKRLRLAVTFLPFQAPFLPSWCSSLAYFPVKFHFAQPFTLCVLHSFFPTQHDVSSCYCFLPLICPCFLSISLTFLFLLPSLLPGSECSSESVFETVQRALLLTIYQKYKLPTWTNVFCQRPSRKYEHQTVCGFFFSWAPVSPTLHHKLCLTNEACEFK